LKPTPVTTHSLTPTHVTTHGLTPTPLTTRLAPILQAPPRRSFSQILSRSLACNVDTDCVQGAAADSCVAACGTLTSESGASAVQSAANTLCEPFLAAGCKVPGLGCIVSGQIICAGGTCARYDFDLAPYPLPTFIHGLCTALQLNYDPSAGSPDAPRDLVASMTASNGTLYSDPECATPLTTGSLTIPSGSSSVAFGFTPTAPGLCLLELGVTYSFTAQ
jgi:hypothetical protein